MSDRSEAQRARFDADRRVLAEIGRRLFAQETRVQVRLPGELAQVALDAWNRDEVDESDIETPVQARARSAAASLALIGLAVAERGVVDGDYVIVHLDAWQIGDAFREADELGLIQGTSNDT